MGKLIYSFGSLWHNRNNIKNIIKLLMKSEYLISITNEYLCKIKKKPDK